MEREQIAHAALRGQDLKIQIMLNSEAILQTDSQVREV